MEPKIKINTENYERLSPVVKAFEEMIDNNQLGISFRMCQSANSSVLALVTLEMWPMVIKGFRLVSKSYPRENDKYPIKLLAPSLPYKNKFNHQTSYAPIFTIDIYSIWKKLEANVVEAYNQKITNE